MLENPAEGPAVSGSISIGKLTTVAAVAQSETEKRRLEEMVANAKLAAVDLQEKEEESVLREVSCNGVASITGSRLICCSAIGAQCT